MGYRVGSVETGLAVVTGRMLSLLPAPRAAALAGGPVTIDLDTTDVEACGRKKRGVACNHQGQRVGRPHVAAWAETETVVPGRVTRHARHLTLRLPPGHGLLPEVPARLRDLPAPA